LEVNLKYGLGQLNITANRERYDIDGWLRYNPDISTPRIDFDHNGATALLTVAIESRYIDDEEENVSFTVHDFKLRREAWEHQNEMEFRLPTAPRTDLNLKFGMGSAYLDLTGIKLSQLVVDCGLSEVTIVVNKRNKVRAKQVRLECGLGELNATGLGNLRAKELDLEVGLGSAMVDLRGKAIGDMEVTAKVGLGSLDLTLPEEANIRLTVEKTFLSSVDIRGLVKHDADEWVSPDWKTGRPVIEMNLSVGLGSVDVDVRD
jgi:hypothetical protein